VLFSRILHSTGTKDDHRVGHSFLLEFLSNTQGGREHLWIMDPGGHFSISVLIDQVLWALLCALILYYIISKSLCSACP